jgi:hypothetical protein
MDWRSLPPYGSYVLEVLLKPAIVRDEYRDAQIQQVRRLAGYSRYSNYDRYAEDPEREEALANEEQMKQHPAVAMMEFARRAQEVWKRPDIARVFLDLVAQMGAGQEQPGGPSPEPFAGPPTNVEPMPFPRGGMPGGQAQNANPNNPAEAQALGQLGRQSVSY